jgi:hypothetical protein
MKNEGKLQLFASKTEQTNEGKLQSFACKPEQTISTLTHHIIHFAAQENSRQKRKKASKLSKASPSRLSTMEHTTGITGMAARHTHLGLICLMVRGNTTNWSDKLIMVVLM